MYTKVPQKNNTETYNVLAGDSITAVLQLGRIVKPRNLMQFAVLGASVLPTQRRLEGLPGHRQRIDLRYGNPGSIAAHNRLLCVKA